MTWLLSCYWSPYPVIQSLLGFSYTLGTVKYFNNNYKSRASCFFTSSTHSFVWKEHQVLRQQMWAVFLVVTLFPSRPPWKGPLTRWHWCQNWVAKRSKAAEALCRKGEEQVTGPETGGLVSQGGGRTAEQQAEGWEGRGQPRVKRGSDREGTCLYCSKPPAVLSTQDVHREDLLSGWMNWRV